MQMPEFLAQYTGQPAASLVGRWSIRADLDGSYKVTKWSVQGINAPTSAEIIAGLAQADPVSHLAGVLVAKASAACDAITAQVLTAQTHTAGYTNAAAWATAALLVDPSDGGVPTADPGKTAFTNMAAANRLQDARRLRDISAHPLGIGHGLVGDPDDADERGEVEQRDGGKLGGGLSPHSRQASPPRWRPLLPPV